MTLTQEKEDKIYNALVVGMALEDAYILAGLTETEIEAISQDHQYQAKFKQLTKEFELGLLNKMKTIAEKQTKIGRESATTWMLEHMFPRYSGKPQNEGGEVHLHFENKDPVEYDTVEYYNPRAKDKKEE